MPLTSRHTASGRSFTHNIPAGAISATTTFKPTIPPQALSPHVAVHCSVAAAAVAVATSANISF